jgi:hypothetical protein
VALVLLHPDRKNSRYFREELALDFGGGNSGGRERRHCGCYRIPAPDRVEGMTVTGFAHAWILQVRLKEL